jgi:hypothetical protein
VGFLPDADDLLITGCSVRKWAGRFIRDCERGHCGTGTFNNKEVTGDIHYNALRLTAVKLASTFIAGISF